MVDSVLPGGWYGVCSQPCKEVLPQPIDEEKLKHMKEKLKYLKSYQQALIPLLLDEEQYEYVSLAGLTFHPERYNGKKVRVSGYLTMDYEKNILCDRDPLAYCMGVTLSHSGGRPEFSPYSRILKFARTGERIFVRGVFDANQLCGRYACIMDIVEVMRENTKRFVFDDPSDKRPHVWTEEDVLLTNPIIADPERHDGKVVLVYGYITDYPFQMCPSLELIDTENCIELWRYNPDVDYDEKADRENKILSEFIGKRAYVRGVFNASEKDPVLGTSGLIVKLIEIFEENGPVKFKPHVPNKAEYYPASP
ncbi:MAG: hypothetical protein LBU11_11700 [Zoogloeaceae bacterium]|jgi:hypothetical protein|nr:hypothetical protein [Zoogloeaceae bacterium]